VMHGANETVAEYSYDAWGSVLSATGSFANVNPLRYRGYYFDTETGFYYLQSRYYDPVVKRFLNADSYGSTGQGFLGYNMFAYCGNGPIVHCDFAGTFATFDPLFLVESENTPTPLRKNIKTGSDEDVGLQPELPPVIDEYFDELMMLDARTLENELAIKYEYYYHAFGGDESLAKQYAFYDAMMLFVCNVETGGEWDLKNKKFFKGKKFTYKGEIYSAEDLGNIHFGYVGSVLFPKGFLHLGAGGYQLISGANYKHWATYFDTPRDYDMIEYGYKLYVGGR